MEWDIVKSVAVKAAYALVAGFAIAVMLTTIQDINKPHIPEPQRKMVIDYLGKNPYSGLKYTKLIIDGLCYLEIYDESINEFYVEEMACME